jgi:hypothetical protein
MPICCCSDCDSFAGMKLDKRIEEAVPAGQQLQELGMRLRCLDDGSSDQVTLHSHLPAFPLN